jgi:hypothetical protein
MRPIAILCAARKTSYRDIEGLEIFDEVRDARTFAGGMPVVAHPPCRYWIGGGFGFLARKHAKPGIAERERELGLFCARQVQENGGILEQPAKSGLFAAAGLPLPGSPQSIDSFSLHVWQRWWGYPTKKGTWLYFRNISQFSIEIPFCLHNRGFDRWEMDHQFSARRKSETVPAFANWLVDLARGARMHTPEAAHGFSPAVMTPSRRYRRWTPESKEVAP